VTESIALIDYGAGNLRSVANALRAAGANGVIVTSNPDIVAAADRIVLPGVGAFAHCRDALTQVDGLVDALEKRVRVDGVPFLGICVGMQLLADSGEEHGTHAGLGWIGGTVRLMEPADPAAKIPHMGWNDVRPATPHPLVVPGEAYFLHSSSRRWRVIILPVSNITRKRARLTASPPSKDSSRGDPEPYPHHFSRD
jgi:imidazole glycerol-phosphate synthase subunit HisH